MKENFPFEPSIFVSENYSSESERSLDVLKGAYSDADYRFGLKENVDALLINQRVFISPGSVSVFRIIYYCTELVV